MPFRQPRALRETEVGGRETGQKNSMTKTRRAVRRGYKAFGSPGTRPGEVIREARCRRGGRWEVIPTPTPDALAATLLHRPCDKQQADLSGLPSPGLSEGPPGVGVGPGLPEQGRGFPLSFEPSCQVRRPAAMGGAWAWAGTPGRGRG